MRDEIDLLDIQRGSVSAPAGCGKTHLIATALKRHAGPKPILVLTHTNAGVAALRGRLDRASVPRTYYKLSTIDGWAMRIISLFPMRSGHDPRILKLIYPSRDYPAIRKAAAYLLQAGHLNEVLAATYHQLIVDEYQDCSLVQHAIVGYTSQVLNTCVLGDPLQAIFGFSDRLVDWTDHVQKWFPAAGELTIPHRWINAGAGDFGEWLLDVRRSLLAGTPVDLRSAPTHVTWVELDGTEDHARRLGACRTPAITADGGVLSRIVNFAGTVMTGIDPVEFLASVKARQIATSGYSTDAQGASIEFCRSPSYSGAVDVLVELNKQSGVTVHRQTIFSCCIKTLRACREYGPGALSDAAIKIREENRLVGRPLPRRAVGSTLLLKGLEAEVAVMVDLTDMNRAHLYVGMTRGSTKLLVCSPTPILTG